MANPELEAVEMTDEELALDETVQDAEVQDEQVFDEMSPAGDFSKRNMSMLTKALNSVLPLFGQEAFPVINEDIQRFPADLTRVLAMVATAVSDAIAAQEIDEDVMFSMEDIVDDESIKMLAGKLTKLGRDKAFKKFLSSTAEGKVVEAAPEAAVESAEPTDEDMDSLFSERF